MSITGAFSMERHIITASFAVLILAIAGTTRARQITYSTGTSSFSYRGDTETNNAFSGSIDVPLRGSVTGTLQTGTFSVVNNGNFSGSSSFNLTETFVANGFSSTVGLAGTIVITPPGDTLTFTNGSPTTIDILGSILTITPNALVVGTGISNQTLPYTLQATSNFRPSPSHRP